MNMNDALRWSLIWIVMSFLFNGLLLWTVKDTSNSREIANDKALEFLTGYLIEKSLAVNKIFVDAEDRKTQSHTGSKKENKISTNDGSRSEYKKPKT